MTWNIKRNTLAILAAALLASGMTTRAATNGPSPVVMKYPTINQSFKSKVLIEPEIIIQPANAKEF